MAAAEEEGALAKDVAEETKAVVPVPSPEPPAAGYSKALVVFEDVNKLHSENTRNSKERDTALAKLETEKRITLIRAWEQSKKMKAENKASKKISDILSWENAEKAAAESKLKKKQEELEKKKTEYAEKVENRKAMIHWQAEEKRAMAMALRGEEVLKVEEMAAKYRATGTTPKKFLGCFGA